MITLRGGFLHELMSCLSWKKRIINPFLDCLKLISKEMKLSVPFSRIGDLSILGVDNFEDYSNRLGIMLCKVNAISMDDLASSIFPLLAQEETTDQLYVILKCDRGELFVYDALGQCYIRKNYLDFKIKYIWQCYQIDFIPKSNFIELIKFVLSRFGKNTSLALIFGVLSGLSGLLISVLSGYVFSHLYKASLTSYSAFFYAFFFLFIAAGLISAIGEFYAKLINAKVVYFIMPGILSRMMDVSLKTMNQFTSGEVHQRVSDYESVMSSIITNCFSVIYSVITLVVLMSYLLYCNSALALIYLLICILYLSVKILFVSKNITHISHVLDREGKIASFLNEIFLQISKVRSSHAEKNVFNRWLKSMIDAKVHAEQSKKIEIFLILLETVLPVILSMFFYYKVYLSADEFMVYFVLQFMVCANQFLGVFDRLSLNLMTLMHSFPKLKRLDPFFKYLPVSDDCAALSIFDGSICLDNVSCCADNQKDYILKNITMNIKPGEFVAIIGESGSGKSTLLRLLLGFESVASGKILYDGKNMNDMDMQKIRKKMGVVLQTTTLFPGTIFSNIAANTTLTFDDAWKLLQFVGLEEDIQAMPMKMHTYLSDNASESISGGQCQKILIARALASKPTILLLDEATSALDAKSQEKIYKNLQDIGVTKIVVAHRLSTVIDADRIYVLKKGQLIDCGTYEELNNRGYFNCQSAIMA